jgi:hypothetical protein
MPKNQKRDIPSFGQVYQKPRVDYRGERIDIDSLVGQEFVIQEYKCLPSKFGKGTFLLMQIEYKGKPYILSTGSQVVQDQLQHVEKKPPFKTKMTKPGRYYKLE